jgi:hypothetical protein
MKNLLIATLIVTGLGLSGVVAAQPAGLHHVQSATLDNFQIDNDSHLSRLDIFTGNVSVDKFKRQIHLTVQFSPDCPINALCAPGIETITLPMVDEFANACNVKVYRALRDMMPADGVRAELTVYDNSGNTCPTFALLSETQVDYQNTWYNRIEGGLSQTFDRFEGATLENIFFPFN